eukprot:CAMPEP_0172623522 /NCGR_PEP_ID=MMETSP1068-20121228/129426_1 /TAXON_ID=35684 /ORGANISM="Pseudopedinella elastica, Strain CCMP716" /LENGTH=256 /DNA_ID=CAMNT_0013432115 /DNA_START=206 /DNA_END=977 /DNA_ORIENTATION=+
MPTGQAGALAGRRVVRRVEWRVERTGLALGSSTRSPTIRCAAACAVASTASPGCRGGSALDGGAKPAVGVRPRRWGVPRKANEGGACWVASSGCPLGEAPGEFGAPRGWLDELPRDGRKVGDHALELAQQTPRLLLGVDEELGDDLSEGVVGAVPLFEHRESRVAPQLVAQRAAHPPGELAPRVGREDSEPLGQEKGPLPALGRGDDGAQVSELAQALGRLQILHYLTPGQARPGSNRAGWMERGETQSKQRRRKG